MYYVEDLLGSSRVIANPTGAVCYDADFYPYGGERVYTNRCPQNNYKFEGKERDSETSVGPGNTNGNDDFGARYYSNRFGRWLSADWSNVPVAVPYANLTNPQTLNLYSMVADDPESFADLDGHCDIARDLISCKPQNLPGCWCAIPPRQAQNPNQPGQLARDEAKGISKEIYNTVADFDNWFYSGVNALLGTHFYVEEFQPATPGEERAMLGTSIALFLVPGGGEEKAAGKIASLTADAEKLYPKLAGKFQNHHIIPQYLGGARNGATARIPGAYHQLITNEFRRLAPYGQKLKPEALAKILKEVYSKYPLP